MGNTFDGITGAGNTFDPHLHQQHYQRGKNTHISSSSSSSSSNIPTSQFHDALTKEESNDALTKEESNSISEIWSSIQQLSSSVSLHDDDDKPDDLKTDDSSIKEVLKSLFISPLLVNLYLKSYKISSINDIKKFVRLLTRETTRDAIETIWILLDDSDNRLISFFNILLEIAIPQHNTEEIIKVSALFAEMLIKYNRKRKSNQVNYDNNEQNDDKDNNIVLLDDFISWCHEYAPFVPKLLETVMTNAFFSSIHQPSYTPFHPVYLTDKSDIVSTQLLLPLALYSSSCQGQWKRLYTTQTDGWAFNRISHHILGYSGPTCIIFKSVIDRVPHIFGSFNADRWKDSNAFFGSSSAFLFTLTPELQILRNKNGSNNNYQWLNTRTYGKPHGFGMGGTVDEFRIFIPDSMENCYAAPSCLTFESGKLISRSLVEGTHEFRIDALEIWACGGTTLINQGLNAQKKYKDNVDDAIKKAQKCDKAAFFGNAFDQEMFLSKTMAHKQGAQDRADV